MLLNRCATPSNHLVTPKMSWYRANLFNLAPNRILDMRFAALELSLMIVGQRDSWRADISLMLDTANAPWLGGCESDGGIREGAFERI